MPPLIQTLLAILLLAATAVCVRLYLFLGETQKRLQTTLEQTQRDVNQALQRMDSVAQTTEKLMREELTPTLQVARQTLKNVEVTTHALANVTQAAHRVAQKAEGFMDTGRLAASGASAAKGVFGGLRALIAGRKKNPAPVPAPPPKEGKTPAATKAISKTKP